jgi:hypothetical protein
VGGCLAVAERWVGSPGAVTMEALGKRSSHIEHEHLNADSGGILKLHKDVQTCR